MDERGTVGFYPDSAGLPVAASRRLSDLRHIGRAANVVAIPRIKAEAINIDTVKAAE
jgi:hypothetical protein